jgi:hypothetical protein
MELQSGDIGSGLGALDSRRLAVHFRR